MEGDWSEQVPEEEETKQIVAVRRCTSAPGQMFQVRMKVETATSEEAFQVRRPRMLWGETRQRAYLCVKQLPFF